MKDELHTELDRIVPPNTKKRSMIRIIGHMLIELDLMTSVTCGYDDCIMPTRDFTVYYPGMPSYHPGQPTIDHVVELWDGGSDMPNNIQLLHFKCNSRKGQRRRMSHPEIRAELGKLSADRWQDPDYRSKVIAKTTAAMRSDDVRARKSEAMKRHWADPSRREQHSSRLARGERHRAARPDTPCDVCGNMFKGLAGVKTHKLRAGCG